MIPIPLLHIKQNDAEKIVLEFQELPLRTVFTLPSSNAIFLKVQDRDRNHRATNLNLGVIAHISPVEICTPLKGTLITSDIKKP